jgi:hypothetical protein
MRILHCKLVHLLDMFSMRYSPAFVSFFPKKYTLVMHWNFLKEDILIWFLILGSSPL